MVPSRNAKAKSSKAMPSSPSDPAAMPIKRKISATGTPNRSEARLNSTLTIISAPNVTSRIAVLSGSATIPAKMDQPGPRRKAA